MPTRRAGPPRSRRRSCRRGTRLPSRLGVVEDRHSHEEVVLDREPGLLSDLRHEDRKLRPLQGAGEASQVHQPAKLHKATSDYPAGFLPWGQLVRPSALGFNKVLTRKSKKPGLRPDDMRRSPRARARRPQRRDRSAHRFALGDRGGRRGRRRRMTSGPSTRGPRGRWPD